MFKNVSKLLAWFRTIYGTYSIAHTSCETVTPENGLKRSLWSPGHFGFGSTSEIDSHGFLSHLEPCHVESRVTLIVLTPPPKNRRNEAAQEKNVE